MNTIFDVTPDAKNHKELEYGINLGQDCLQGKTQEELLVLAAQSEKIKIQGAIRKLKDTTPEGIQAYLRQKYPNATVGAPSPKTPGVNATAKALMDILGEEEALKIIAEYNASKA